LIIPCEVAAKSVVPAVRALITKELVEKHNLKQDEVAKILGISQSAVSKYTREVRGYVIKVDEIEGIKPLIDKMVSLLVSGTCERQNFLKIFCQTCIAARKTGVMCRFCQKSEPNIRIEECGFCLNLTQSSK